MLYAKIHEVSTGEHDQPKIHFSLHDGEDTGQVSFLDTMGLAHATFLMEHGMLCGNNAYCDMVRMFSQVDDAYSLVGWEFVTKD